MLGGLVSDDVQILSQVTQGFIDQPQSIQLKRHSRYINKNNKRLHSFIFLMTVTAMSVKGIPNLIAQRNIIGSYDREACVFVRVFKCICVA
jgi:hypothetical protein